MASNARETTQSPDVLVPFSAWGNDYADLADQLNKSALKNMSELLVRNMGSITHFADPERSRAAVRDAQREDGDIDYFAAVDTSGSVIGMGYIDHEAVLREQRPLVRIGQLAVGHRQVDYPYARPMIRAWTYAGSQRYDMLPDVYRDLLFRTGALLDTPEPIKPWTVEPLKAPKRVHAALASAGLQSVGLGNWSYGNTPVSLSPKLLYAHLNEDYRGQIEQSGRRELRTNRRGFMYWMNHWPPIPLDDM
jgi:hypothetical protein